MLKQKANINFDAGRLLVDKNLYSPSIHCFYYSCLQLIKYAIHDNEGITYEELEQRMRDEQNHLKTSSHKYLINTIGKYIYEYNEIEYSDFNNKIGQLKALRVQSDYVNVMITSDQCVKAESFAIEIRQQLNEIFHV